MDTKAIYARITLEPLGSTYIQPLGQLTVLIDEIREAASEGDLATCWRINLVAMTQQDYETLPEFEGL